MDETTKAKVDSLLREFEARIKTDLYDWDEFSSTPNPEVCYYARIDGDPSVGISHLEISPVFRTVDEVYDWLAKHEQQLRDALMSGYDAGSWILWDKFVEETF